MVLFSYPSQRCQWPVGLPPGVYMSYRTPFLWGGSPGLL